MKVSSDQPGKSAGWWHKAGGPVPAVMPKADDAPKLSTAELVLIDRQCRTSLTPARLNALAVSLTVSAAALTRINIGWHAERGAFTFPMRDAEGRIIGIRTRHPDGSKKCLTGSRLGLVIPVDADTSPDDLLISEGESDTAAGLDLGFQVIARPGCEACASLVVEYVARVRPGRVVLLADADDPGQRGADKLARLLARKGIGSRMLTLPDGAKDLRS